MTLVQHLTVWMKSKKPISNQFGDAFFHKSESYDAKNQIRKRNTMPKDDVYNHLK